MPEDKGAHFHKCDFQVHSLRDASWSGPFHPVNDRAAFCAALVADARRKGVQALGITDHHDLCLWKGVADAAQSEQMADGTLYPSNQRLVVFPGIELTLSTPACQAILLFDPALTEAILAPIWGALRLAPTANTEPKTTQTVALDTDLNLTEITKALNAIRTNPAETNPGKYDHLEGKFILLPNVKRGGHQSMMRNGFQPHFIAMPCIGGYIEGALYSDLDASNRAKLEGKDPNWGNRKLGVFQTSDCREAKNKQLAGNPVTDFTTLGAWPTWVKWAQPSAEALRQACLASQSRILHSEPAFPLFQIVGVTVSNSQFLGKVELGLNPQFNAFIGGRGTGKSSLLEYIRWALCDDPLPISTDSLELPNFQKRRKALIDVTLKPSLAKVAVFYKRNEVIYKIERSITDRGETLTVTDALGNTQPTTSDQIRREFPIVSYAQKQLSCVGTLPEEINRLITDPVKERLDQIQERIENTILPAVRQQRATELRLETLKSQADATAVSIKSKKEQIQALQSKLTSLAPEQQKVIQAHDLLSQQEQWLNRALGLPTKAADLLRQTRKQVTALGAVPESAHLPATLQLKGPTAEANAFLIDVAKQLDAIVAAADAQSWLAPESRAVVEGLRKAYETHRTSYDKYVQESAKNKTQLDEIQGLNQQVADLEGVLSKLISERVTLQVSFDEIGKAHSDAFFAALKERATLLQKQCQLIGEQAQYEFKAEFAFCADEQPLRKVLEKLILGRNVKDGEQKIRALTAAISATAHPIGAWEEVMAEFDALLRSKGTTGLPATKILKAAGFTDANLESLRNGITSEMLEQIRFLNINDQIRFLFRMGKNQDGTPHYISFDSASPGQQATCLLRTLLAQAGAPLLIDQPEEDLDNEQIHILSGRIAETKHNRQLIFVSHNANIVVNGDAELVVCFGYSDVLDNTKAKIDPVGSIDGEEVRDTITKVMEGGREAFEMRKNKYGF